jgi:hypothetical protein
MCCEWWEGGSLVNGGVLVGVFFWGGGLGDESWGGSWERVLRGLGRGSCGILGEGLAGSWKRVLWGLGGVLKGRSWGSLKGEVLGGLRHL